MIAHLRSMLIRRTVLAGTAMALATAGVGGAYMHLAASPSPSASAPSPAKPAVGEDAHHHCGHHRFLRALVTDTAKQTNQTPEQVVAELKAGKTLDQIAGSKAATVKQDVIAAAKTRLDRAVSAGRIDAAREKALLDKLSLRLDKVMNTNLATALQHLGQHRGPHAGPPAVPPAADAAPQL